MVCRLKSMVIVKAIYLQWCTRFSGLGFRCFYQELYIDCLQGARGNGCIHNARNHGFWSSNEKDIDVRNKDG